jgi:CCR4-NOT transcription complex subunit 4
MNVPRARSVKPEDILLENLLKAVNSPDFRFVFSTDGLSDEDLKFIENGPSFIDPYGGVKRRAMREKNEQEHAKQEAETHALLQSAVVAEEETRESGSLQLGGEPEDLHLSRGPANRGRESHGAIQPPSQQGTASNSAVGSPVSINHQFQNLNLNTRSLTPLQQQQVLLLKSANGQQPGLMEPLQTSFDQTAQGRQGLFQGSMPPGSGLQGHTRQASRFSFANDSNAKNASNARILGQQASLMQSGTTNPLSAPAPQQGLSNQFYTSSVQGPPPGLKTAGTPPISGGGMFAQGHGFTTNTNLGLGGNIGKQEANPELMRELLRGRSGTAGTGGVQGHEAAKREFMFPFLQQHQTPPPLTPATGLLSAFYGSQAGTFAESGPQKQKKKGKKHRHANTSSGGGGVVDLADPSILQARMHQVGVGASGQALYGSQGQGGYNHSMMYGAGFNRW